MKECTAKYAEAKAPAAMRQEKNDAVASRAKEGCDEHLRSMDEERARGREELARVGPQPKPARSSHSEKYSAVTSCSNGWKGKEQMHLNAKKSYADS